MSRSYKKTGASSICSSYGDKWCRNQYHRSERRKVRKLLNQVSFKDCYLPEMDADLGCVWDNGMCMLCKDSDEEGYAYCENLSDYMDNEDWYFEPNYCFNRDGCGVFIPENNPIDKILTKGIDYSLRYADRWSWASDGGSYWRHNKETIRKEFDKEVFCNRDRWYWHKKPQTIWDEYVDYVERKHNDKAPTMSIRVAKAISISTRYSWLEHKEVECVKYDYKVIKTSYNKEHQFDTSLIPEGYQVDSIWKTRGKGFSGTNKWEEIQWNMIPLDFKTPEELINWLRNNQERMINTVWKKRYGK